MYISAAFCFLLPRGGFVHCNAISRRSPYTFRSYIFWSSVFFMHVLVPPCFGVETTRASECFPGTEAATLPATSCEPEPTPVFVRFSFFCFILSACLTRRASSKPGTLSDGHRHTLRAYAWQEHGIASPRGKPPGGWLAWLLLLRRHEKTPPPPPPIHSFLSRSRREMNRRSRPAHVWFFFIFTTERAKKRWRRRP